MTLLNLFADHSKIKSISSMHF